MVKTKTDIKDLPPDEKIKLLKKIREEKKDLEDELKTKLRDLEEMESSLKDAEDELEEEKKVFEEELLREKHSEASSDDASLESVVEDEVVVNTNDNVSYDPFSRLGIPNNIYELTNNAIYEEVKRIEQKGYITAFEQQWLLQLKDKINTIRSSYSDSDIQRIDDLYHSIPRIESVLKNLDDKLYDLNNAGGLSAIYKQ